MTPLPDDLKRVEALGYTESEARFLYLTAVFSGYFTLGQFRFFTGTKNGKRSAAFAQKLLKNRHATSRDCTRRGSVFHLFSRNIYGPIGKDNLRNRKRHSPDFVRTRLVLLDFILENPGLEYFETEQSKVGFFCQRLGIPSDFLPAKVYRGRQGQQTTRYFVDKFPLLLAPPVSGAPSVVTFSYVDSGCESASSFASHLLAYRPLFRQLNSFRFVYITTKDAYFQAAEQGFRSTVKTSLESDSFGDILRYFQIRKKWDNNEYIIPITADLEFLVEGRRRFQGEAFEKLYRSWLSTNQDDTNLRSQLSVSHLAPDRRIYFDTYLVSHQPLAASTGSREADEWVKGLRHPVVHRAVHPEPEPNSNRA